jgi:hypothetical protein
MDPAFHRLTIVHPPAEDEWDRLQAELDRHGPPLIAVTRGAGTVKFTAETWEPILRARVEEAVDVVWPHGAAWRTFRPLE